MNNIAKTNIGLVGYAKEQVGKPYWYGTFGQVATESLYQSKKNQYPDFYTANDFTSQIGQTVHDCIGLCKGYIWRDNEGVLTYNSSQDKSAQGTYNISEVKGTIGTIPDIPGILVYKGNSASSIYHVGIYGGDGFIYEAKGHEYGVVKTVFKAKEWQFWGNYPYITYESGEEVATLTQEEFNKMFDVMLKTAQGDISKTWAKDCTEWAKENKIVTGDGDGNYQWELPVVKQEVCSMIYQMAIAYGFIKK